MKWLDSFLSAYLLQTYGLCKYLAKLKNFSLCEASHSIGTSESFSFEWYVTDGRVLLDKVPKWSIFLFKLHPEHT